MQTPIHVVQRNMVQEMDATAIHGEITPLHVSIDTPILDPIMNIGSTTTKVSAVKEIGEEIDADASTFKAVVSEAKVHYKYSKLIVLWHTYGQCDTHLQLCYLQYVARVVKYLYVVHFIHANHV